MAAWDSDRAVVVVGAGVRPELLAQLKLEVGDQLLIGKQRHEHAVGSRAHSTLRASMFTSGADVVGIGIRMYLPGVSPSSWTGPA